MHPARTSENSVKAKFVEFTRSVVLRTASLQLGHQLDLRHLLWTVVEKRTLKELSVRNVDKARFPTPRPSGDQEGTAKLRCYGRSRTATSLTLV
jgi:hypothetical protein